MKKTTFFERILQIIEYHEIKSVNSFAKDYLKYDSSEKINRLKDENKRPSVEILEDIANRFENINTDWLLMGRGEMMKKSVSVGNVENIGDILISGDHNNNITGIDNRQFYSDSPDVLRAQVEEKDRLLREKDERIREKDERIREKDERIREKDERIKELMSEKEELKQIIKESNK